MNGSLQLGVLVVLVFVPSSVVHCHKVLFLPIMGKSHILMMGGVAEALVKHGHQAHILKHRSVKMDSTLSDLGVKFIDYGKDGEIHHSTTPEFARFIGNYSNSGFFAALTVFQQMMQDSCRGLLKNEEQFLKLKAEKYDFVVSDNSGGLCNFAVPHRLEVPYANLAIVPPIDQFSLTLQINYITPTLPFFYASKPSFFSRFIQFIMMSVVGSVAESMQDTQAITEYIKDKPLISLSDLSRNVKLWFVDVDPLIAEPRQTAPSIIYIGGITVTQPKPLPTQIAKFADSATKGFIVVSFGGSLTAHFPQDHIDKLFKFFAAIKYKVIMRLENKPSYPVSENVLLVDWMPQNDLLAHSNVVLFITHCGSGSINEAVYHGVPMIGVPNMDEQQYNAKRMVDRGFGERIERSDFTVDQLLLLVDEIVTKPERYRKNVQKVSSMMRSRKMSPGDEAVYWIDHVVKYGADQLIPYTVQLSWYQILMLDIIAAIVTVVLVVLFILVKCFCFCFRCCRSTNVKQKTS